MAAVTVACYDPPKAGVNREPEAVNYSSANSAKIENRGNSSNSNTNMTTEKARTGFTANLPSGFAQPQGEVEKKLLGEYGAMFVAKGVTVPTRIVFKDEAEVSAFQSRLQIGTETVDGKQLELQKAAMDDLKNAIAEAKSQRLSISPRDVDSARRSYDETVGLWRSRVEPALKHWVGSGKISQAEADRISAMSPFEQVPEVLKLEEKGIYFAKDFSKSIIYSVAPPGTSQHLSMLALDVKEFDDEKVRSILAKHRWYQTVASDLPHFTYLGVDESELPGLGLKKVNTDGRVFWIPGI